MWSDILAGGCRTAFRKDIMRGTPRKLLQLLVRSQQHLNYSGDRRNEKKKKKENARNIELDFRALTY